MIKMYFYIAGAIFLLLIGAGCSLQRGVAEKGRIKILTYNIRNARGMDSITDYDRIAKIINEVDANCVVLQELDSATVRSKVVVVIEELGKRTNMYPSYSKSIDYQGGSYGVGILTKSKPLRKEMVPLPGREEKRSFLMVEMEKYVICCTHLSLNQEDRLVSVEEINLAIKKFGKKPVFLAGDFNAEPVSPEIQKLGENWIFLNNISQKTFPSDKPEICIDYILAHKESATTFRVKASDIQNGTLASDHLPVWAIVKFK